MPAALAYVSETEHVRPVFFEDLIAESIYLNLPTALHTSSLKTEIEAADACKKRAKVNHVPARCVSSPPSGGSICWPSIEAKHPYGPRRSSLIPQAAARAYSIVLTHRRASPGGLL